MKRIIAIIVAAVLVIVVFAFAIPAGAEDGVVFQAEIVPGAYPAGESSFEKGEVKVYADGSFDIEIEGAQANEIYYVLVGEWIGTAEHTNGISWYQWDPDVTITTDGEGEGKGHGILPSGTDADNWSLFALNDVDKDEETPGANRFVSGFAAP